MCNEKKNAVSNPFSVKYWFLDTGITNLALLMSQWAYFGQQIPFQAFIIYYTTRGHCSNWKLEFIRSHKILFESNGESEIFLHYKTFSSLEQGVRGLFSNIIELEKIL